MLTAPACFGVETFIFLDLALKPSPPNLRRRGGNISMFTQKNRERRPRRLIYCASISNEHRIQLTGARPNSRPVLSLVLVRVLRTEIGLKKDLLLYVTKPHTAHDMPSCGRSRASWSLSCAGLTTVPNDRFQERRTRVLSPSWPGSPPPPLLSSLPHLRQPWRRPNRSTTLHDPPPQPPLDLSDPPRERSSATASTSAGQ